ncbi:MAG: sulfotransferase family protein [Streptosporangiaceae bacterium]
MIYQPTIDATAWTLLAPPKPIRGAHVIVLTHAQPGAGQLGTLLTMHPSLACTAGTGVLQLCEQAATTWRCAERTGSSLSTLAAASVRALTGSLISVIRSQEGQERWCEISSAPARSARTFLEIYPETKIICLHRDCVDIVHSVLECSQRREGRTQRDLVAEAAAHWQVRTESLLALERGHAAQCLRVRYEDLVASPATTAGILTFLGLDRRPELDWCPGEAAAESRLQEVALLTGRIGSPLLEQINRLLVELHYPAIDRVPTVY